MESFFSIKSELRSNGEAKMELFDYIEVFITSGAAIQHSPDQPGRL